MNIEVPSKKEGEKQRLRKAQIEKHENLISIFFLPELVLTKLTKISRWSFVRTTVSTFERRKGRGTETEKGKTSIASSDLASREEKALITYLMRSL